MLNCKIFQKNSTRFFIFLHKRFSLKKFIFENFQHSWKICIISVEAAKVLWYIAWYNLGGEGSSHRTQYSKIYKGGFLTMVWVWVMGTLYGSSKVHFLPSTPISSCATEDNPMGKFMLSPTPPPFLPHQSHRSTHSIPDNQQCVKEGAFTKSSFGFTWVNKGNITYKSHHPQDECLKCTNFSKFIINVSHSVCVWDFESMPTIQGMKKKVVPKLYLFFIFVSSN